MYPPRAFVMDLWKLAPFSYFVDGEGFEDRTHWWSTKWCYWPWPCARSGRNIRISWPLIKGSTEQVFGGILYIFTTFYGAYLINEYFFNWGLKYIAVRFSFLILTVIRHGNSSVCTQDSMLGTPILTTVRELSFCCWGQGWKKFLGKPKSFLTPFKKSNRIWHPISR